MSKVGLDNTGITVEIRAEPELSSKTHKSRLEDEDLLNETFDQFRQAAQHVAKHQFRQAAQHVAKHGWSDNPGTIIDSKNDYDTQVSGVVTRRVVSSS
jgi:hypothetical protein